MAMRLPGGIVGAESYWRTLRDGTCAIRKLDREDLEAAGVPAHLAARPDYVPYAAPLDEFDHFDADFFGLSPKEAAIMDPQHRQFLETAWEALENAGHAPDTFGGKIGVFAGCGMGSYFYFNVCSNPDLVDGTGMFLLRHTGNDKDFLSTRVSHFMDLKGPSVNLQTACSTSLVAVHYAAQALLNGECDMALAGGVTIELPQGQGYLYKENEVLSPDGHCRAFDHRAQGTVFGSGAGVVTLRRLEDAIRDGDPIWAVIRGTAINNDGADKAGYLAPSVSGQADAISMAQEAAGVTADQIGYVECHGTGTYLGDPIEVAAMTEAFRRSTDATGYCRIGSVKTNIGHLDTAAGVASLIKATLALHHEAMPPTLGYEAPNPAIDFDTSPFRVNDRLTPWPKGATPRRAGVNSLGVGGTNAHAVIEEAPQAPASEESAWPFQLLTLSARSETALDAASGRLSDHLRATDDDLADIAWTLKEGRHAFDKRRVVVAESAEEAATLLRENDPRRVFTQSVVGEDPEVVFMFPGGGAQYAGMARDLYDTEPVFREWMDKGLAVLEPKLDYDVRALWLPEADALRAADERLKTPSVQLPLIMIVEYALAQLWMSWGVKPSALIGHSMGENTAACLAGVMSFEDCIGLVHLRGSLFDTVPDGGMLSVALPEADLRKRLSPDLDIASINAPSLTVATGPMAALDRLEQALKLDGIDCQRIAINIAAHSRMLEPILADFGAYLRSITLKAPAIPFVSNRSGTWITEAEATDPDYWVGHLRGTVRFADGISTLAEQKNRLYLEVGPGRAMISLAAQNPDVSRNQVIGTLRDPKDAVTDDTFFVTMLGRVWAAGGRFDWSQIWAGAARRRVRLPSYPFQRKRYFIEPGNRVEATAARDWLMRIEDREQWGWKPVWKPTYADCAIDVSTGLDEAPAEDWLVFVDDTGLGSTVVERLRQAGHRVIDVRSGDTFARTGPESYVVAPELGETTYESLVRDLASRERMPTRLAHFWMVTGKEKYRPGSSFFHRLQEEGFWSLFHFSRAWASVDGGKLHLSVFTSDTFRTRDEDIRYPAKATVLGPLRVIPREFPGLTCSLLDLRNSGRDRARALIVPVLEELLSTPANTVAAVRGSKRFVQDWAHTALPATEEMSIAEGSVVMITGGLGGIGLTLAEALVRRSRARIAYVARTALPPRADWEGIIRRSPEGNTLARRLSTLIRLEKEGGQFLGLAADVSNPEEMARAVATVTETWGKPSGLIHAAGAIADAPILSKTTASISEVFTPKVYGTQVLEDLFPDGSLDWMVLFSSSSTATAPAGQVDYVAANEYLNTLANARQGGSTRVLAIDWGVWAEVGMAAEAIEARDTHVEKTPEPVRQPLLDGATRDENGDRTFVSRWRTRDQWVLDEHRTKAGDSLLPGTGYLELAAQALAADGRDAAFEIRDLTFLTPLRVEDEGETSVRVTLPRQDGGYGMQIRSALDGKTFELNAEAQLRLLPMIPPASLDLDEIGARCPRSVFPDGAGTLDAPQAHHLRFGPRWQVLRSMHFGEHEGVAHLVLPQGDTAYHLHPGLMDIATGWAVELIEGYAPDQFWVPVSYGSVRVFGALPSQVVSWARLPEDHAGSGTATFDITLCAPDGVVCAEIRGFTIRRLAGGIKFAAARKAQPARAAARTLSPAEERLRHNVSQGIQPADGAQFFLRALASPQAQVLVSSLDLKGLIAQVEHDARPRQAEGQTFERPDLDSDYVEPEGAIERRLAKFWTDLLGIDRVGAEDNFFDLGGHSLIAVRLFAMVKSAFHVDFPISVLFEAPTIRKCAVLIVQHGGGAEGEDGAEAPPGSTATPARRFTHLVPMHHGQGGEKTPLFIVAGMFGNVLNLRHLAHLVSPDRPVYGLQARGLLGGDAPHDNLVEAATDCIAEIRQIQPSGPYMLSGFSGGGLTAFEMAQQLTRDGEEIASLILLDTPLPQERQMTRRDRMALQRIRLREEGPRYLWNWAARRVAWEIEKRRAKDFETSSTEFHNAEIEAAFRKAISTYQVSDWAGAMTLFRPPLDKRWEVAPGRWVKSDRTLIDEANDWRPHAPKIEVFEVPGDHDSMVLEPNVRVLAARMRAVLEASEPKKRTFVGRHLRAAE
ncbi:acyltransferase domain-containing protein [Silicimonas algicola]|nr:type I polyketide synthase [Silicimonas algicola]AZQ69655.1 acyltransferase domain-containing protein [Silicimonas algicola]